MYDFRVINDVTIQEYTFKTGLAHFGMVISDGNIDHTKRICIVIPGFCMDSKGMVISKRSFANSSGPETFPEKINVEKQLFSLIENSKITKNEKIFLCLNEETKEIGMAVVPNKKWYPVFSII